VSCFSFFSPDSFFFFAIFLFFHFLLWRPLPAVTMDELLARAAAGRR